MARNELGIRRPGTTHPVAATTVAASSSAVGAHCTVVRLATNAGVFFKVGGAAATLNDAYLPPNYPDYIKVNGGETISFITATGTAAVTVTEME